MNAAVVWCATALASIVLPVPGGPQSSTPRGGSMPICTRALFCQSRGMERWATGDGEAPVGGQSSTHSCAGVASFSRA
jgi:hypothetical protein